MTCNTIYITITVTQSTECLLTVVSDSAIPRKYVVCYWSVYSIYFVLLFTQVRYRQQLNSMYTAVTNANFNSRGYSISMPAEMPEEKY